MFSAVRCHNIPKPNLNETKYLLSMEPYWKEDYQNIIQYEGKKLFIVLTSNGHKIKETVPTKNFKITEYVKNQKYKVHINNIETIKIHRKLQPRFSSNSQGHLRFFLRILSVVFLESESRIRSHFCCHLFQK